MPIKPQPKIKGQNIGKRGAPTGFRPTPSLRSALEESSENNGRSLSQEIESRLERSFAIDDHVTTQFGGPEKYQVFRMLSAASETIQFRTGKSWLADEDTATSVNMAWQILIDDLLPSMSPEKVSEKIVNASPLASIPEMPEKPLHPFEGTFASRLANMSGSDIEKHDKEFENANATYGAEMDKYEQALARQEEMLAKNKAILDQQEKMITEWLEQFSSSVSEGVRVGQSLFPSHR